jgi:class 3 adenylate cyclase
MPVCTRCAQANPETARFCVACGAPLEAGTQAREVRKRVTIVFADVTGSTELGERLDPEALRRVMGRYFDEMSGVVERHGGTVEKFIGDAVMAVFGIPLLHEDDALRAVLAAAEMRGGIASLNEQLERELGLSISLRVGVNTGEVLAGDPGHGDAFATGDAVNVAARLEQLAKPGEILVGQPTYSLVRDSVTVEHVGPLALKGKGDAVQAFRLVSVAAGRPSRLESPFVGRGHELSLLSQEFERVSHEQTGRLTTVVGAAGVGKSRLVEEFLAGLADDATIVRGRCLPYGEGITYWPVREAVTDAAGLSAGETPDAARERIRSLLAAEPDADLIAERVAEVVGLSAAAIEHRAHGWAIGRLFQSLASRCPLVAVFDDIQWAETTFLDLVESVAQQSRDSPMLLLCLARPELLERRSSWQATIRLEPLSEQESEHLVESLLGAAGLANPARARITEAAEGNPLFVEELVAMLIEEGVLERRNGSWVAAGDLGGISIPPSIHALLAARVERLGAKERAVLERGSVEGKVFHRGAVLHLLPEDERQNVAECLASLVAKDILRPQVTSLADEDGFSFRHQLLREAAYESVRKEERALLHERFAAWLEKKVGARASEYEEILGYHLERAFHYRVDLGLAGEGDRQLAENAAKRLGTAGLRARARGDLRAAANLLSRAIELTPSEGVARQQLASKLREVRFESGELKWARISWASMRCFWRWRFGHKWVTADRVGELVLRCADCGKPKYLPRWAIEGREEGLSLEELKYKADASGRGTD